MHYQLAWWCLSRCWVPYYCSTPPGLNPSLLLPRLLEAGAELAFGGIYRSYSPLIELLCQRGAALLRVWVQGQRWTKLCQRGLRPRLCVLLLGVPTQGPACPPTTAIVFKTLLITTVIERSPCALHCETLDTVAPLILTPKSAFKKQSAVQSHSSLKLNQSLMYHQW